MLTYEKGYPQVETCNTYVVQVYYKRMGNRSNIIQIRLTDVEVKMVEALCERMGDIPKSDAVRRCIQDRYKREFPVYITEKRGSIRPLDEELTPEQACEKAGGTVVRREGTPVCQFKINEGFSRSVPLDKPELFPKP